MFSYYGTKKRLSSLYPKPKYSLIVEPFCGAAGYACLYPEREVKLYDIYPAIVKAWRYLILATKDDVMSLPLVEQGQQLTRFGLSDEERCFLGFMISASPSNPKTTVTERSNWTLNNRALIAKFVEKICHWEVGCKSYVDIPSYKATWFIDPPYQQQGKYYTHHKIDYQNLASKIKHDWRGQRLACDLVNATWGTFNHLTSAFGQKNNKVAEGLWIKED